MLRLELSRAATEEFKLILSDAIGRVDAVANAHFALQDSPDLRSIGIDSMLESLTSRGGALNPSIEILQFENAAFA